MDSLDDMLRDEQDRDWRKDVAKGKETHQDMELASDEEVITSAPSAKVGSLLTDLLNEAKKEVAQERASLDAKLKTRADEDRLAKQREEARRRQELQEKLMEETRRRNKALTRREAQERVAAGTERVVLNAPEQSAIAPVPEKKGGAGLWLALAAIFLLAGGGGAAWFVMQPKADLHFVPQIESGVPQVIDQTLLAWNAQQDRLEAKAAAELQAAEAAAAVAKAKEETARAEKAAAEAQQKLMEAEIRRAEQERLAAENGNRKPVKKSNGSSGSKIKINTKVF